jgi:hypothetical protein
MPDYFCQQRQASLEYALLTFCGADAWPTTTPTLWNLTHAGIGIQCSLHRTFRWRCRRTRCTRRYRSSTPLSIGMRRNLKILTAFYHHVCRSKQGSQHYQRQIGVITTSVPRNTIPTASQLPSWTVKLPGAVDLLATGARLFDQVPRTTNHSGRSLLDSLQRSCCVHDQSHGLEHLIDPDYVVKDAALDQLNAAKILQDIMQAPPAKAIVVRHLKDKDTRPPMEGDSRSLRLHDSAANSWRSRTIFVPSSTTLVAWNPG